jgi:hypothetical protein
MAASTRGLAFEGPGPSRSRSGTAAVAIEASIATLRPVKRWLLVALAAGLLAAALWHLGVGEPRGGGPPLDQIDDASREKLREVLREPAAP